MDFKKIVSDSKDYNYLLLDDSFFKNETSFNSLEDFKTALDNSLDKDFFIQDNTSYNSFEEFNSAVIGLLAGKTVGYSIKNYLKIKKKRT